MRLLLFCATGLTVLERHVPPVDFYRADHAVKVDGKAGDTAAADAGFEVGIELEKLFFEGRHIHVVCAVLLKYAKDLLFDLAVSGAVEGDPDGVVAVLDLEGREVLEVFGELAVVIVSDVKIRKDLDQAGADLAQACLFAFCVVVRDDADDGGLDGLLICEGGLGITVVILVQVGILLCFGNGLGSR